MNYSTPTCSSSMYARYLQTFNLYYVHRRVPNLCVGYKWLGGFLQWKIDLHDAWTIFHVQRRSSLLHSDRLDSGKTACQYNIID